MVQEFRQRLCCAWEGPCVLIATVPATEFLISAHCLMILYTRIYTKICETISQSVSELSSGHVQKFTRGYNSIKNVGGVTVLVLCISSDNALYLSQIL